ncbi:hypothetical protein [Myroides sp. WP-1]|uniref:hypothetical protein n=1 Tax=Myroides sp. WP-1 TaxID=2759944 RepID=UPI0015F8A2B7|nr:hypothetical protein [Myroides sp. WP-1]MBB1138856.1 hypothetical protein [Myroides sp. WP-1]
MIKKYCIILGSLALFTGCEINDDYYDRDQFIRTENLEQYGCYNTKENLFVPSLRGNEFIIINNSYDYRKLVQGCNAAIDFRYFDLIIGQYWVESNTEDIKYVYRKNRFNEFILSVDFLQNWGGRPRYVTYHAIVPKLHPNDPVYVETAELLP